MTEGNDFPDPVEPVLFTARLMPHRSLGARGFLVLMVLFSAVSFAAGVAFWIMGAWPVFGFFGLDVAILYVAFRVNVRRATASEDIRITPSELRVRRVSHRGHMVEWTFNPLWVRLERVDHPEFGVERLTLLSHGRRVSIGRFLGADEKASFAVALTAALNAARRGPVYNP